MATNEDVSLDDRLTKETKDENGKVARAAAKKFYHFLKPSDKHMLKKETCLRHITSIREKEVITRAFLLDTEKGLSEDMFVEKIMRCLQCSDSVISDTRNSTFYQKCKTQTARVLRTVFSYVTQVAAARGLTWLKTQVPPMSTWLLLLFIYVSNVASLDAILLFLPFVVFCSAFLVMRVGTELIRVAMNCRTPEW